MGGDFIFVYYPDVKLQKKAVIEPLTILSLAFLQNVSFSMVSRARNRDSTSYHLITSIISNTIWFLCFRELVLGEFGIALIVPYIIGTCIGSIYGTKLSMKIEKLIGATADGHISK